MKSYPSFVNLAKNPQYYTKSLSMKAFQGFQDSAIMGASILLSTRAQSFFAKGGQRLGKNPLTQFDGRGVFRSTKEILTNWSSRA